MKTQTETPMDLADIFVLLSKYKGRIIFGTIMSLEIFLIAAFTLPKKYKSHFVLTIYSTYFQNPLIRDFSAELYDAAEMNAQRESLIREALTPDFLDSLGRQSGVYQTQSAPSPQGRLGKLRAWVHREKAALGLLRPVNEASILSRERELLLSRIEVISLKPDTYQVSFIYSDPNITYQVTQALYAQVVRTLAAIRTNTLINLRDAIRKRMESIAVDAASEGDSHASVRTQAVRDELANVRRQIRALSAKYTQDHPAIKELKDRERTLVNFLDGNSSGEMDLALRYPNNPSAGIQPESPSLELYKELMKKMSYLNIAIESDKTQQHDYVAALEVPLYPSAPLWPKKGLFALWGIAAGMLGSLLICSIREYSTRTALHAETLAQQTDIPLLGKLPRLPDPKTPVTDRN